MRVIPLQMRSHTEHNAQAFRFCIFNSHRNGFASAFLFVRYRFDMNASTICVSAYVSECVCMRLLLDAVTYGIFRFEMQKAKAKKKIKRNERET